MYTFVIDCAHLARMPLRLLTKLQIFLAYLLNTLFLPIAKILDIKTINFLGFSLKGFNFRTLHFLLGEIFVRNDYFFQTDNPKPLIIDCGAEVGFTTSYFKYLFPDSSIYAFEPDSISFNLLQKNITENKFTKTTALNAAVSNYTGKAKFYTSDPGNLRMSLRKDRLMGNEVSVKTIKLSEFIKNKTIDYLKIDIEGHETTVLKDLVRSNAIKKVLQFGIEYHHHISPTDISQFSQFLSLLENNGFKYQLSTRSVQTYNSFQDIMISAYRI